MIKPNELHENIRENAIMYVGSKDTPLPSDVLINSSPDLHVCVLFTGPCQTEHLGPQFVLIAPLKIADRNYSSALSTVHLGVFWLVYYIME